jgi:hypothetical protein
MQVGDVGPTTPKETFEEEWCQAFEMEEPKVPQALVVLLVINLTSVGTAAHLVTGARAIAAPIVNQTLLWTSVSRKEPHSMCVWQYLNEPLMFQNGFIQRSAARGICKRMTFHDAFQPGHMQDEVLLWFRHETETTVRAVGTAGAPWQHRLRASDEVAVRCQVELLLQVGEVGDGAFNGACAAAAGTSSAINNSPSFLELGGSQEPFWVAESSWIVMIG